MLLSNKCSDELGYGTVESQRDRLQQMSQAAPGLNLGSPSVFDGIVLWNTLRAQSDNLSSGDIWNRTAIRQLNIEPKLVLGGLFVPIVSVVDVGEPFLSSSYADFDNFARVSLG